jgi:hypothetical protein
MKAGLSVSLGFLFVGLATFNVITMLQSSRSAQAPRTRARAIAPAVICSSVYSR